MRRVVRLCFLLIALAPAGWALAQSGCTYTLQTNNASLGKEASSQTFFVSAGFGCGWTATSNSDWLTVSKGGGSGFAAILYSVAANTGSARTGTILVGGQVFTVFQQAGQGGSSTNLIANSGFESGSVSWNSLSAIRLDGALAHSGNGYARLGGRNSAYDVIYQDVAVPLNSDQVVLLFWRYVSTTETTTNISWDKLDVQIIDPSSGAVRQTVAGASNLDAGSWWIQTPVIDLTAFRGQVIRLKFVATTDFSSPSTFYIDDVSLVATTFVGNSAVTVSKSGTGLGSITSAPAGIDCGATCTANFSWGTAVRLSATPEPGSGFAGWSGGGCSGTGPCFVTVNSALNVSATFTVGASIPRLGNISTRMQVLTGNDVLIGGFIIGGSQPKTVVVRARGPSLAPFGITNALADPKFDLYSGQTVIASNDDWGTASNAATLQTSGFAPSDPKEAAIYMTLSPGAYTAIVSGVGNTTGVGIIEVFEVDLPQVPMLNISTRGRVLTGNDVMIGGFIIQGDSPQTVVVRARGPSLVPFGITNALANPVLQLFSGQTMIASNDDWQAATNAAEVTASGFAPSNPLESAILITLPPGAYTVIVTGAGGGTGVGIVEVFAQ